MNDEHSEVAKVADDYLWLKLCQIHEEHSTESQVTDRMTYAHLQSLILEEYGRYHHKVNSVTIIDKWFRYVLLMELFCNISLLC